MSRDTELQIKKAVEILKNGGIVAYPTDTVYGLGCDVFNLAAVERIYRVKRRPMDLPLPVLLDDLKQLDDVVASVPETARCLINNFWPGGLTLVLLKKEVIPDVITAGSHKVAVRIPNHAVPLGLIRGLGKPIIGTSANISDKPSPVTAEEVEQQIKGKVDLIIDSGRSPGGVESTVVDVTGERPVILRRGIIPEEEINRACNQNAREVDKSAYSSGL